MPDVDVRPATTADASALVDVYHSAYRQNRELGFPAKAESIAADTVREWIRDHYVLVATVDDAVAGGVRLEDTGDGRAKLSRLAVHDDQKGGGIGTTLLDAAERHCRDRGFDAIWLTTPPEHPFLPDLYRDRGYERTGDYPLDYRDYDEIVMEKPLD